MNLRPKHVCFKNFISSWLKKFENASWIILKTGCQPAVSNIFVGIDLDAFSFRELQA